MGTKIPRPKKLFTQPLVKLTVNTLAGMAHHPEWSISGTCPLADASAEAQSGCGVEAEALQPVTREMVAALKLGEEHKQKSYVATCRLSAPPDPGRLAALNASTDILVRTWWLNRRILQSNGRPMFMAVPLPACMPSCAESPGSDEFLASSRQMRRPSISAWPIAGN